MRIQVVAVSLSGTGKCGRRSWSNSSFRSTISATRRVLSIASGSSPRKRLRISAGDFR